MQFKPYEVLQRRDVRFVHALLGMHLRVGMVVEQLDLNRLEGSMVEYLGAVRAGRVRPSGDVMGADPRRQGC